MPTELLQLDRAHFLAHHWQRESVLIPQALHGFTAPISADELAGLAMEEAVESRIIRESGDRWDIEHGPFSVADLQRPGRWSLLVQSVDHHWQSVAELRRLIDFLPQWRLDDIMISYSTDGASVGPHWDNYDVFLLQASGAKQWRLGPSCDETTALKEHPELRLLDTFECRSQHRLLPGDVLYVPPGIAHWGIASGAGMTISIGFRAPRVSDLVSRWTDAKLASIPSESFYSDPPLTSPIRAGEITAEALEQARAFALRALQAPMDGQWFGELVTERGTGAMDRAAIGAARERMERGPRSIVLAPEAGLAWHARAQDLLVFANGGTLPVALQWLPFVSDLCNGQSVNGEALTAVTSDQEGVTLLGFLLDHGCIDVR
ncbi:MAG: cupin domain-containing protein [Pseudomonadota bacterium]